MAPEISIDPFGPTLVDEVHLDSAPLVRVLTQLRFPSLVVLNKQLIETTLAPVLSSLASEYPISETTVENQIEIGPQGVRQIEVGTLATIQNADSSWKLNIGSSSLSLETSAYTSRSDFLNRLRFVLEQFLANVSVPRFDRVGFRYTNRIDDPGLVGRINELFRPELVGSYVAGIAAGAAVSHSLSESVFRYGEINLGARSAYLLAGGSIDPSITPSQAPSWTLDLDAFTESPQVLDLDQAVRAVDQLSGVAHRYFRWSITPEFLKVFGGPQ